MIILQASPKGSMWSEINEYNFIINFNMIQRHERRSGKLGSVETWVDHEDFCNRIITKYNQ